MDIKTVTGKIHETEADHPRPSAFFKDGGLEGAASEVDETLGGALLERVGEGDFKGETGEVTVLYPRGALTAKRASSSSGWASGTSSTSRPSARPRQPRPGGRAS